MEALPLATVIQQAVSQCAGAQHAAAESMWERFEKAAFTTVGGKKEVAMIQFNFVVDGKRGTLRIPLLTILPAQYIQIRDVEVDFNVSLDMERSTDMRRCPVKMAPSRRLLLQRKTSDYDLHNNISVTIKAGALDMSGGMARLLELAGSRAVLVRAAGDKK